MRTAELLTDRIRRFFRSTRRLTWKPQEILAEIDRIEIGFLREGTAGQEERARTAEYNKWIKENYPTHTSGLLARITTNNPAPKDWLMPHGSGQCEACRKPVFLNEEGGYWHHASEMAQTQCEGAKPTKVRYYLENEVLDDPNRP